MGSVISSVDCPVCGGDATEDFYYKSGEIYIFCSDCGYYYKSYINRDIDGVVMRDDKGEYIWVTETNTPFCSYTIEFLNGSKVLGHLDTEKDFKDFKRDVKNNTIVNGIKSAVISMYKNGEIKKIKLKLPKPKRIISEEDPYGEENWG